MADVISFTNAQITQLSHLFGDEIMTGSEISRVLTRVGIQDNSGASTKMASVRICVYGTPEL